MEIRSGIFMSDPSRSCKMPVDRLFGNVIPGKTIGAVKLLKEVGADHAVMDQGHNLNIT